MREIRIPVEYIPLHKVKKKAWFTHGREGERRENGEQGRRGQGHRVRGRRAQQHGEGRHGEALVG